MTESGASKLHRVLRGDLDNIVLKTLRKEPERRYASVEQFADDIRSYLEGRPVSAAPDSFLYRARKFIRRHQVGVAAAFLILIAIAGGVFATLRQARIAAINEQRAEARFEDVRALANSMLFDVHDSIADLPGATSARRLLINRAVSYLDQLEQETNGDPRLQRELAAAYQRLGDVQGAPRAASLGDSGGALQSYLKALHLREGLVHNGNSTDDDQFQLGEMHRVIADMLHFAGDLNGALEHARKAVTIDDSILNANLSNRSKIVLELSRAYKALGEVEWSGMAFGSLAEYKLALNDYRKGLTIATDQSQQDPGNMALARSREFLRIQTGRTLVQNGARAEGIHELRAALAYFRSVSATSNSQRAQRDLSAALEMFADGLQRDGQYAQSLACYQEDAVILAKVFHSDPENLQARFDFEGTNYYIGTSLILQGKLREGLRMIQEAIRLEEKMISLDLKRPEYRTWQAVFYVREGEALAQLHRERQALSSFESARTLYDSVASADPLDMDEHLSTAAADAKIGGMQLRLGNIEEAKQAFHRAMEISEPAVAGNDPKQQAQYTLAEAYAGLGDISLHLAGKSAGQQQITQREDACGWYKKGLGLWQSIPNPSLISPNGFDADVPNKLQQRISLCEQATPTGNIH